MEWNDAPDSALMRSLRRGKLPHPTSSKFEPKIWAAAVKELEAPTERDFQIMLAAVNFGTELSSLRAYMKDKLTAFSRKVGVRLLAAMANQQYLVAVGRSVEAFKSRRRGQTIHFEMMDRMLHTNAFGQETTTDDAVAALVDSLPNWLFHIWAITDNVNETPEQIINFGQRAMTIASIERGLRDLWQGAVWQGDFLTLEDDTLIQLPGDRALDQRWFVWDMRNQLLLMNEASIDRGAAIIARGKIPPVIPVSSRTVIRLARRRDGRRRFIVGRAVGHNEVQRAHVSERDMLDRIHVGPFLSEPLPDTEEIRLTCRELNLAWWVLTDLARLVIDDLGKPEHIKERTIGRFSIAIEPSDLHRILEEALEIEGVRSQAIINFFTCDPSNASEMFGGAIWSAPLNRPGTAGGHLV